MALPLSFESVSVNTVISSSSYPQISPLPRSGLTGFDYMTGCTQCRNCLRHLGGLNEQIPGTASSLREGVAKGWSFVSGSSWNVIAFIALTLEQKNTRPVVQRPVICSSFSVYRAPCTVISDAAMSMSRSSSGVGSRETAPRFSSRRCSLVVPGMGTIHGF